MKYLNMEHIYEIYGSTEAVITTANKPGDPVDSVGEVANSVVILNDEDKPCPPGIAGDNGRLLNYYEAVGEIAKKADMNNLSFVGWVEIAQKCWVSYLNPTYPNRRDNKVGRYERNPTKYSIKKGSREI